MDLNVAFGQCQKMSAIATVKDGVVTAVGKTGSVTIKATVYGVTVTREIQPSDSKLKWKCDNKEALTVNNGMLTAEKKADKAVTVTATYSFAEGKEIQATYSVKVLKAYVKLNKEQLTMKVGDKVQLSATSLPEGEKLTYKSSNSSIAKVSSNGTVTAVKASNNKVTITVTNESGQSDTCQVKVEK